MDDPAERFRAKLAEAIESNDTYMPMLRQMQADLLHPRVEELPDEEPEDEPDTPCDCCPNLTNRFCETCETFVCKTCEEGHNCLMLPPALKGFRFFWGRGAPEPDANLRDHLLMAFPDRRVPITPLRFIEYLVCASHGGVPEGFNVLDVRTAPTDHQNSVCEMTLVYPPGYDGPAKALFLYGPDPNGQFLGMLPTVGAEAQTLPLHDWATQFSNAADGNPIILRRPGRAPRQVVDLDFTPAAMITLAINGKDATVFHASLAGFVLDKIWPGSTEIQQAFKDWIAEGTSHVNVVFVDGTISFRRTPVVVVPQDTEMGDNSEAV